MQNSHEKIRYDIRPHNYKSNLFDRRIPHILHTVAIF